MAIQTVAGRNLAATAYATNIGRWAALTTTVPGANPGTEVTGGTYARLAPAWGTADNGAISADPIAFNVPAGTTVAGFAFYDDPTAGNYLDGCSVTSQEFASDGTYSITPTYTEN